MKKEKKDKEKEKEKEKKAKIKKTKSPVQPAEAIPAPTAPQTLEEQPTEPLAYLADVIGGKWKPRILWAMSQKSICRYGDIKRTVHGITDMMLSQSLKDLVSDGLVQRVQYQEIPPRVEYSLTERGASLLPILAQLRTWAARNNSR